jgi:hypothetical protein
MNVYQRINEVRKQVAALRKTKSVETYKAITHDQVTAETRDHFVTAGVIFVPKLVEQKTVDTGTKTKGGTPFVRCEAVYDFAVVNSDDPADQFTARILAHAIDHGDKAPGKVLSYAKKALILKLLEIESYDADEDRPQTDTELLPLSEEQVANFLSSMDEADTLDALKTAYTTASNVALELNDKAAMKKFIDKKTARKVALTPTK